MGSVYLARHVELQKNFALKLILHSSLSNPQSLARFRNEAKALGKLQHPSIVQVTDYGIDPRNGGIPYLVMEWLQGKTLLHFLRGRAPLEFGQAIRILEPIAGALDCAHSMGILHRDLSPKNVFLAQSGSEGMQVKILDFGLAKVIGEHSGTQEIPKQPPPRPDPLPDADVTQTYISDENKDISSALSPDGSEGLTQIGTVMGTPGYIAPEIRRGQGATNASDIYSFGVLVYRMIGGKLPFNDSVGIVHAAEPLPVPSSENPQIPRELEQALLAPLHDEPDRRPAKAAAVVRGLQNAYAAYQYRLWRAKEWPKRIGIATGLTLALIFLVFILQGLPFFRGIEHYLSDLRFRWLPSHSPDKSIVLVTIDESSLQADPTLLVNRASEMGTLLQRVFDAGARAIALDFLLPESWGQSENFSRLILNNRQKLILGSYIKEDGDLLGMECLNGLIMAALGSEERAEALFGFLNVKQDSDGRVRSVYQGLKNRQGQYLFPMPAKACRILTRKNMTVEQPSWIDFSIDWTQYAKIPWKDLTASLNQRPDLFRDKIVLVGGEYEGSQDIHRIPAGPGFQDRVSGLTLQALALDTLLQNRTIRPVHGFWVLFPMALVFLAFSAVILTRSRIVFGTIALCAVWIGCFLVAAFLLIHNRLKAPVGTAFLALALGVLAVFIIRRGLKFVAKPSS